MPSARTSPTALPSTACRRSAMTCSKPASPPHSRTPPPRWPSTGPTWRPSPGPRRTAPAPAPTPRPPGGTARTTCPAPEDELFFGYYLSAAIMVRGGARAGRPRARPPDDPVLLRAGPGPRPRRGLAPHARGRHPASVTSWPTPATPTATPKPGPSRCAPPARSWSRTCTRTTAAPRAPTTARSSPTGTCTAPPPRTAAGTRAAGPRRHRGGNRRARPADRRARPPQARPRSAPMTPTATTASCAPPPRGRSAARSGPNQ